MYINFGSLIFREAYQVACLGVTENDWNALAEAALEDLDLSIARQSFVRLRDWSSLELVAQLEAKRHGEDDSQIMMAEVQAHQGRFSEAARNFKSGGEESRAMNMYSDLRQFDQASLHHMYMFCSYHLHSFESISS